MIAILAYDSFSFYRKSFDMASNFHLMLLPHVQPISVTVFIFFIVAIAFERCAVVNCRFSASHARCKNCS